jgi:DNA-binding CsgD family transcriptional regulator
VPHMGFDRRVAVSPGYRNAMVAVLDEVQLPDPIDVDWRHRFPAAACRGDRLPPSLDPVRSWSKKPVKLATLAIDAADDRIERDLLDPDVALGNPPQGGHHVIKGQQCQRAVGLCRQAQGNPRQGRATTLASKCRAGIGFRKSNEHARHVLTRLLARTYGGAGDLTPKFRNVAVGKALPSDYFRLSLPSLPRGRAIIGGVTRVAAGGSALDPEVVGRMLGRRQRDRPLDRLSPRERDVLAAMAEGKSNHGIAHTLLISQAAVEKHVTSIFHKLKLDPAQTEHRRVLAVLAYLRDTPNG